MRRGLARRLGQALGEGLVVNARDKRPASIRKVIRSRQRASRPLNNVLTALAAALLISACSGSGNGDDGVGAEGPAVASDEVARVWSNLDSGKRTSACAAYRLSELFDDDGDGDAPGVGFIWSGGSLSSLDPKGVEEAWRVLLEENCPTADEFGTTASDTCWIKSNKHSNWGANCSIVPGTGDIDDSWYTTGKYTFTTALVELCIPVRHQNVGVQTRTGNSEIPWRTRAPFNPRTDGRGTGCPGADGVNGFAVWKFNIPEDVARSGDELRIVTGKNLKKPLMKIQISFAPPNDSSADVNNTSSRPGNIKVWIEFWDRSTITDLGDGKCNVRLGTRLVIGGETHYLNDDRNLTLSEPAEAVVELRKSAGGVPSDIQNQGGIDGRPCVFVAQFDDVQPSAEYTLILGECRFTWESADIQANDGWASTFFNSDQTC